MRRLLASLLPLALAACASEQWVKDSGEVASREVITECSQKSWARARYEQMAYPSSVPTMATTATTKSGNVFVLNSTTPGVPFPQQDVQEQAFFNLCMKENGYALVSTEAKP